MPSRRSTCRAPGARRSTRSAGTVASAGVNIIAAAITGVSGSASPWSPSHSGSASSQASTTEVAANTPTASQGTRVGVDAITPPL